MRYTGKILTSALALSLAFQSVPALVSHAEEDFLDALVTLHGDSDIKEYDIALGVYCNEYTIPTELANGKIVGLDLAHVYVRNYMFDMKNSDSVILHIPEGVEITNKHWRGVFTGVPSITLIYASGEKEKLLCDDYEIAKEYTKRKLGTESVNSAVMLEQLAYHPLHREMEYEWHYYEDEDRLYRNTPYAENNYEGDLRDTPSMAADERIEINWYDNAPDLALDKISMVLDENEKNAPIYAEEFFLNVTEDVNIVYENWRAEDTRILKINIRYPSGEVVTYKADDWDDFQKDSGRFTGYNRMIAALGYFSSYDFEIMGEGIFNSGEIWLLSTSETAERTIGMTDTDKLLIQDAAYRPGKEVFYADELRIPDNIKVLGLGRSALSGMEINKLILPACEIQVRCYSSSDSTLNDAHIKELVIDGDIHLEHQMFQGNEYLESVTFNCDPDIDFSTFWDCPSLKNINISLDKDINGQAFYGCHQLMTINGESPIRDDGSIKPEYLDFIKRNFNNADGIGFIDKYTEYCVKKTVSETVTEDMPDIVKVKALHDKLCSMVSYDFDDIQALKNHVDSSVFLNETSVCEGYAKGLNLLLHEAGVPSCYVNTGEHAWVIVKVGNHYFHVDPTWDDGDEINYNWFMKSDSQFENKEFHSDWKLKLPSEMHRFQWETLPKCSDIMGDIDGNKNVDARDATAILISYASASAGGKELADSVLADYNFDGIVDGRDASAVLAYYTGASV